MTLPKTTSVPLYFRHFSDSEIPNNTVFDVHQDDDGFIWIATQDGFARFEGTKFRFFRHSRNDKTSLHDNICYSITTSENKLWVSTQTGVAVFNKQTMQQIDTLFTHQTFSVLRASQHHIFAINGDQFLIWDENGERVDSADIEATSGFHPKNAAFFTNNNTLIQKQHSQLSTFTFSPFDGIVKRSYSLPENFLLADVFGFLNDSTLLLRKQDTVFSIGILDSAQVEIRKLVTVSGLSTMERLHSYGFVLPNGNFWALSMNSVLFFQKTDSGNFICIPVRDGLSDHKKNQAHSITFGLNDAQQRLWIADQYNGLSLLDARQLAFKNLTKETFHQSQDENLIAWAFAFNDEQTSALIAASGYLFHLEFSKPFSEIGAWDLIQPFIKTIKKITSPDLNGHNNDVAFRNGKFYINAFKTGIIEYNPNTHHIKKIVPQTPERRLYSVTAINENLVWSGFKRVLIQHPDNTVEPLDSVFFADASIIYNTTFNESKHEWVISEFNSVLSYSLESNTFKTILNAKEKKKRFATTAIMNAFGKGETYWISTFGQGVLKITPNDTLTFSIENGLENASIYNIVESTDKRLWISTNRGLHVSDSDFSKLILLNDDLGFPNSIANQNGTEYHKNGLLSVAGSEGVSIINTINFDEFGVFVEHPKLLELRISTKLNQVNVYYEDTFRSFPQSDLVRFSLGISDFTQHNFPTFYRIHPDSSWQAIPELPAEISFTQLQAGNYTLESAFVNPYNFQFQTQKLAEFSIFIPFWERWQTRLFLIVLVLILAAILIQKRVSRYYHKKLIALEKEQHVFREREHLSRDLHDSIGTQLSLIIRQLTAASKEKDTLNKVFSAKQLAQFSLDQLRETIWALKSEEIHLDEYVSRIENLSKRLILQTGIHLEFFIDLKSNPKISPIQLIQSQRILEESLTNAIKYSESKKIHISLSSDQYNWKLSITDFGKGFVFDQQTARHHYGLKHIQERAREIQGTLHIETEIGKGTEISLRLPIRS